MHLPTFLWLWRVAAWSMGLTLLLYVLLALLGSGMTTQRILHRSHPGILNRRVLRQLHIGLGILMVSAVLLLLGIGIVGTLGHFGSLGHSWHLPAGLMVVGLTLASAWSAFQVGKQGTIAREIHVAINVALFFTLAWVSVTGWSVVQKYLPP